MTGSIGKHSLIGLVLIILDHTKHQRHQGDTKDLSVLTNEERDKLVFAVDTAEYLLKRKNMMVAEANAYVDAQGLYYSGGSEIVNIPALTERVKDTIFPEMGGLL